MNPNELNERDDELLTLYYYEDGLTESEREAVATRLEEDAAFRARFDALSSVLGSTGSIDAYRTTDDRRARFSATINALADRDQRARRTTAGWPIGWIVTFAVTASLAIGVAIGTRLDTSPPPTNPGVVQVPTDDSERLVRRVTGHLRDSQQRLLESGDESTEDRQLLLRDIVTRNRSFVEKAEAQGDERLARVLRALEPVLLALAAEDMLPEERSDLSSQLLFELNVVLTKYGQDTSKDATRT